MSLKKKPKGDDHEALAGEESAVAGDSNDIAHDVVAIATIA